MTISYKGFLRVNWPPLTAFVLPIVIFIGYSIWINYVLENKWPLQSLRKLVIVSPPQTVFVQNFGGLIEFEIASTVLHIAAIALIAFAIFVHAERTGPKAAIWITVLSVIIWSAVYAQWDSLACFDGVRHGMIRSVVNELYCSPAFKYTDWINTIDNTIELNVSASIVGATNLFIVFAAVAFRCGDTDEAKLRMRMRNLGLATVCGAIFFVMVTAVNKILADWPKVLLTDTDQTAYTYLAGAIGSFWGTAGALALISTFMPAFLSLWFDIDQAAKSQKDPQKWKVENGLNFDKTSSVGAAIATIAPALAVPGIDLAAKLLN